MARRGTALRSLLVVSAISALAALVFFATRRAHAPHAPPPPPSAAPSTLASASPSPSASPQRVRHPGVAVALSNGGTMHEAAPYLVPDSAPRPVTIILHAFCADEIWMCDWLQYGDLAPQWQVCPRGPTQCGNGGAQWTVSTTETLQLLELAVETTRSRHGPRVDPDAAIVLAGMSQGAYAVSRVVHELASQEKPSLPLRGIVLHGARVTLSAADLKKLGIRVVLAAGEQDAAAPAMKSLATSLKAQGVDAKYESFGDVGHFLPVDSATTMTRLIAWARGE